MRVRVTRDFPETQLAVRGSEWEVENSFPPVYFVRNDDGKRITLVSGEFEVVSTNNDQPE